MVVGIPLSQRLLRKQFLALTVGKFEINRLNQSSYQYHSQNQLKTYRCLIIVQIMKRGRVILERGLKLVVTVDCGKKKLDGTNGSYQE